MKKRKKRRIQAQQQNERPPVSNGRTPAAPYPEQENVEMAPSFSYLFDQSIQEGQEYDVDPRQIHDDRQRRVEQLTTEFPSLRDDEVFAYYEQGGGIQEDSVVNPEESSSFFPVQQDSEPYHTIPIFHNSGDPLSPLSQEDPDLSAVMAAGESVEEERVDWVDDTDSNVDEAEEIPSLFEERPFRTAADDLIHTEGEGPLPLYDQPETPEEIEEIGSLFDEQFGKAPERNVEVYEPEEWEEEEPIRAGDDANEFDPAISPVFDLDGKEPNEEERFWTGPIEVEPVPPPVPGEGFYKATTGSRPVQQSTISPSGNDFVMPSLDNETEQDDFSTEDGMDRVDSPDRQAQWPFDGENDSEWREDPVNPEEGSLRLDTEMPEQEPSALTMDIPVQEEKTEKDKAPDTGQAQSFLQESPELVAFSSLEEDPRRNKPRKSLLDGLTRYLNDDDADVSPVFYTDDDFHDLDENEAPEDDAYVSQEGVSEEEQNQPPLPSSLLFANVSQRPKSQEEFNDLKAHVFHTDLGFRKYHITIANLFDVINVERKLYVKYHPRHVRAATPEQGESTAIGAGNRRGEEKTPQTGEKNKRQKQSRKPVPKAQEGKKKGLRMGVETVGGDAGIEFERPEDVSRVRTELRRDIRFFKRNFYGTGLLALFCLFFTTAETLGIFLPDFMRVSAGTTVFLIVNALLLVGALLLNFDTIVESVQHLVALEFDSDSAVSMVSILCLLQNLLLLTDVQKVAEGSLHLYSGLACLGLALQAGGKLLMHKRVMNNFKFVSSSKPKKAVRLISNVDYSRQVTGEAVQGEPIVAYQTRTKLLSGFMRLSYAIDSSEHMTKRLTPILFPAGLVIGLIAGIVQGSALAGFTVAVAAVCASMPVACMLAINAPMYRMSKSLLRDGILLTSSASVDEYNEVNSVMLDASELFPTGSVVLHGVKKFDDQTVEEVMREAAAVVCAVDGPLRDMFIKNMGEAVDLSLVQGRVEYTDRLGFGGFMNGQPVFVGTADWIRRQGIALPTRDMVQKHTAKGRQILYFAKEGKLAAFFALSHVPEPAIMQSVARYQLTGGKLVLRSTDPFVTERTVSEWFHIDDRTVRVLSKEQGIHYHDTMEGEETHSAAFLATTGRTSSFLQAINACVRAKLNFTLVVVLQAVAMVLGAVIVALFSIFSKVSVVSTVAVLVLLLFWLSAVLILPMIRRI